MIALVLVAALQIAAPHAPVCPSPEVPATIAGVRAVDRFLSDLIAHGVARSITFSALSATIADARVVVYAEWRPAIKGGLAGAMLHEMQRGADGTRYARILIARGRARHAVIATLAHELQHVVEFIEQATDDFDSTHMIPGATLREARSDLHVYETKAAKQVGAAVARELSECDRD